MRHHMKKPMTSHGGFETIRREYERLVKGPEPITRKELVTGMVLFLAVYLAVITVAATVTMRGVGHA